MLLLILFAFIAGFVTILSPCILPVLPIVLSGSVTTGHKRPFGIVGGFIISFTLFTLFLSTIVKVFHIPGDSLRIVSVVILAVFGLSLLIPQFQKLSEILFSRLTRLVPPATQGTGFWGGLVVGLSLGLVWTPCVGPIIASVITLAATSQVTSAVFLLTLAYSLGTAIPMFAVMIGGRALLQKTPWLSTNTSKIQKVFGILVLVTALAIFFGYDRKFQTFVLDAFPAYGNGLSSIDDQKPVRDSLSKLKESPNGSDLLSSSSPAPEIIAGGDWINSNPLKISSLKGKVVLVDFWTYTCINCIRTLPYVQSWYAKYKDDGFVVIGVHTPEFEFEKNTDNVRKAVKDFGLTYPIVQDNDYATWQAYNNQYWPADYLINKDGKIVDSHFGEGDYDATEAKIQEQLKEAGHTVTEKIHNPTYTVDTQSQETYLGTDRLEFLDTSQTVLTDKTLTYSFPDSLSRNSFAFAGDWNLSGKYGMPQKNAALRYDFYAKDVYLVMRAPHEAHVKVLLDGKPVGESGGKDVDNGVVTIQDDRLYHLIHLPSASGHTLELQFPDSNTDLQLYAFTFG
jgi:cytochrome c biogenesis protein CcdA/thiol-disulfide isomerase/thioredoxin